MIDDREPPRASDRAGLTVVSEAVLMVSKSGLCLEDVPDDDTFLEPLRLSNCFGRSMFLTFPV